MPDEKNKVTVIFTLPQDADYDREWLREAFDEMEKETGIEADIVLAADQSNAGDEAKAADDTKKAA